MNQLVIVLLFSPNVLKNIFTNVVLRRRKLVAVLKCILTFTCSLKQNILNGVPCHSPSNAACFEFGSYWSVAALCLDILLEPGMLRRIFGVRFGFFQRCINLIPALSHLVLSTTGNNCIRSDEDMVDTICSGTEKNKHIASDRKAAENNRLFFVKCAVENWYTNT